MKAIIAAMAVIGLVGIGTVRAEPVAVSLADYAYNFPKYGHTIIVGGKTGSYMGNLTSGESIRIKDEGYSLLTRLDRLTCPRRLVQVEC